MFSSSQAKSCGSRMRPYFTISESPDASSLFGRVLSVSTSICTTLGW